MLLPNMFTHILWVGPNTFGQTHTRRDPEVPVMAQTRLDLRDVPPPERHPKIHAAFEDLESGERLTIVNDHEPTPLYYEFEAEVESFDAEGYTVEQRDERTFVAELPKE